MTIQMGDRVMRLDGTRRVGRVVCVHPRIRTLGVHWSHADLWGDRYRDVSYDEHVVENGLISLPLPSTVMEGGEYVLVPNRGTMRYAYRYRVLDRNTNNRIATVVPVGDRSSEPQYVSFADLLEPQYAIRLLGTYEGVGSTNIENNTQESEESMPEDFETIEVPMNPAHRLEVFRSAGMARLLVDELDADRWVSHMEDLRRQLSPIQWRVRRGGFEFSNVTLQGASGVPVQEVPLEVAQEFVRVASGGKVQLDRVAPHRDLLRMRFVNDLVEEAFLMFAGYRADSGGYAFYASRYDTDPAQTPMVSLSDLSSVARRVTQFHTEGRLRREYLRRAMRARRQVGTTNVRKEREWTDEERTKFGEFIARTKDRLTVVENPFQYLTPLPRKTLSSRTWGIEIEAVDVSGVTTPEYWELKGDGSLRSLSVDSQPSRTMPTEEEYDPDDPRPVMDWPEGAGHDDDCGIHDDDGWESCNCGYDEAEENFRYETEQWQDRNGLSGLRSNTGEWVSPVLRSYHSRGLEHLSAALEPRNTNDSAGIHVHVGAKDLSAEQAIRLSIMYAALEPLFYSEYMRRGDRTYFQSPNTDELVRRMAELDRVRVTSGKDVKGTLLRFNSRYWTLNLASLATHGTIEFRGMGPVYNYEHLTKWAMFCREMVNLAASDVPQSEWLKVRTFKDLVVLFSKYGKETVTPEWAATVEAEDDVAKVIEGLGQETRRVPNASRLEAGNQYSPRLVFEDYSNAETFMLGDRETSRSRW